MLEIKGVTKTYKGSNKKAIDNIDLTIEEGDIYGFIGPNGAGMNIKRSSPKSVPTITKHPPYMV